jgi:hypothetical protein
MEQREFCRYCDQRHTCKDAYQQLGKTQGPSIVYKVIMAFLLPIIVFIVSLAVFEKILTKVIDIKKLATAVSFLLALATTFALILTVKFINKRFNKS